MSDLRVVTTEADIVTAVQIVSHNGEVTSVGGGAVDSVNGHTGTVVLAASDVGAQPVDSDLSAIAALSTTTFGRALLALVDAAALRTAAGLGTAATQASTAFDASGAAAAAQAASQPLDSDLTAIAALATTAFGRSLLTQADAASARATIGAGTSSFSGAYSALTGLPTLGTSAAKDIPAAGDASSTQVVYGTDTRLANARTPSAHAASHASAGSDPVTIAESQVTNLVTDLAAKAPLASPTFTGTPAAPTATAGTNTTQVATTAFVTTAVVGAGGYVDPLTTKGDIVGRSASATVRKAVGTNGTALFADSAQTDGLNWRAIAESDVTNLTTDLAAKAPLASPALTGTPTVPTATAGTNSTQAASTAYVDARAATTPINAQTGTSYTLVLTDAGKFVTMTNAAASTLTVPPNSSVAFPIGTTIDGAQLGAGLVTLTAGAGVTINATPGLKLAAQYGTFALLKTATDTWLAMGRLSA